MDELNRLDLDRLVEEYFDEMELEDSEKEEREDFSKQFIQTMLIIFALVGLMREYEYIRREYLENRLSEEYKALLLQYMDIDEYLEDYIKKFSESTIDTTLKNMDDDFFLSTDRAFLISVNEANTGFNYNQFADAVKSGKTRKQWITEKDRKVRRTHRELDDKVIPILEVFEVGKTLMRFPHDQLYASGNLEELYNCRCSIKYF